ncbi:MAG: ADP-glyceromanno-heptose 6-epimerase, partial [Bacteroidota bacterium]
MLIVVTGAAGFIGSCMVAALNAAGHKDLILVDDFSRDDRRDNYQHKTYRELVEREQFFAWIKGKEADIDWIIHLGARTDTTEQDASIFDRLNLSYSQDIWDLCSLHEIPLIYASSAATYGSGERGFDDRMSNLHRLRPLNPYGKSKHHFDLWALGQAVEPPAWAGLKFFNVYGPNEYHKKRMASVVYHTWRQIKETGGMKLFRSHRLDVADGEQARDFIYVQDITKVILFLMQLRQFRGLFNLGTGTARTFMELAKNVFYAMDLEPRISFIDTPADIRATYQYFTEAQMVKIRDLGIWAFRKTLCRSR